MRRAALQEQGRARGRRGVLRRGTGKARVRGADGGVASFGQVAASLHGDGCLVIYTNGMDNGAAGIGVPP